MRRALTGLLIWAAMTAAAAAQGLFEPAARVGDRVVTGYELQQRAIFNRLLGAQGDLRALSLEQLVEDRLRLIAADREGIAIPEEAIEEGMSEFASRANLPVEDFLRILAANGIQEAAFRDFVRAGVAWREVVRARFGSRTVITDGAVRRLAAREGLTPSAGPRVVLRELVLPTETPAERRRAALRVEQLRGAVRNESDFARFAGNLSSAPSATRGGLVTQRAIADLPPGVQRAVAGRAEGEIAGPVEVPGGIALFYVSEVTAAAEIPPPGAVEYAAYYIPGGAAAVGEAVAIRTRVDTCDDLYGIAKGQPAERLQRDTVAPGALPADFAAELARLDENEVSTRLTRGGNLVFLMLCERNAGPDLSASDRERVVGALRNTQLSGFAQSYLEELRADVPILIY